MEALQSNNLGQHALLQSDCLMLDQFEQWLMSCSVATNTRRAYLSRLHTFELYVRAFRSQSPAASIEECSLSYVVECRKGLSASESLRGFCVALKSFCRFRNLPVPQIRIEVEKKPIKRLLPAHQQKLLQVLNENCSDRERAMLAMILLVGLRTGEIIRANVGDLHFERNALLMSVRNERNLIDRILPLSKLARQMVSAWMIQRRNMKTDEPSLFITNGGGRPHPNTVRWSVGKVGNMMGVVLTPQVLRNTFIANLSCNVNDFDTVASLCGLQTTARVAQFVQSKNVVEGFASVELAAADTCSSETDALL
jgi:integrase/recombinase XerC/integrase/recombinase XerD